MTKLGRLSCLEGTQDGNMFTTFSKHTPCGSSASCDSTFSCVVEPGILHLATSCSSKPEDQVYYDALKSASSPQVRCIRSATDCLCDMGSACALSMWPAVTYPSEIPSQYCVSAVRNNRLDTSPDSVGFPIARRLMANMLCRSTYFMPC